MKKIFSNFFFEKVDVLVLFTLVIIMSLGFRLYLGIELINLQALTYDIFFSLTLSIIALFFKKRGKLVYGFIILLVLTVLIIGQLLHYSYFETFFSFAKVSLMEEFFVVKGEAVSKLDYHLFFFVIPIFIFIITNRLSRNINTKRLSYYGMVLVLLSLSLVVLNIIPTNYSDNNMKNHSDTYLYRTLYNKTKAVDRFGLYAYTLRDLMITASSEEALDLSDISAYIYENGYSHMDNEYTGLFEGKNLILVLCESFSPIAIDEELTPTLYRMKTEGFNFENHYSPLYQNATADSEYIAETSAIPSVNQGPIASDYYENEFDVSIAKLFSDLGYSANSFHSFMGDFYNRNIWHLNMGYEKLYDWDDLGLERIEEYVDAYNWIHDRELFKEVVNKTIELANYPFYNLVITTTGHMPYDRRRYELENDIWQTILKYGESGETYSEEVLVYLASQRALDQGLSELITDLEANGLLEDTVIAIFGDHYPYGLTEEAQRELFKDSYDTYEIYKTPFIIWNSETKGISVDKVNSTYDILPTICNLFNIDLEGKLIMGKDLLSDEKSLVIFEDSSWLSDEAYYNSTDDSITYNGEALSRSEIASINEYIFERIEIFQAIISSNYYAHN